MDETLTGGTIPHHTPRVAPQLGQHNYIMRVLQAIAGRDPNENLLLGLNALRPGGILPPVMRAPSRPLPTPRPQPQSEVSQLVQQHYNIPSAQQNSNIPSTPQNITDFMGSLGMRRVGRWGNRNSVYTTFRPEGRQLFLNLHRPGHGGGGVGNPDSIPYTVRFSNHPANSEFYSSPSALSGRAFDASTNNPVPGRTLDPRFSRDADNRPYTNYNALTDALRERITGTREPMRTEPRLSEVEYSRLLRPRRRPDNRQLSFLEALLGK